MQNSITAQIVVFHDLLLEDFKNVRFTLLQSFFVATKQ